MATPAELGLAFGLVIAAGLCTCVGAAIAFCVKLSDHRVLAAALGISAGVMLYVSFVEIFMSKSINGFTDAGYSDAAANRYCTALFFGGMVFTWLLNQVAHAILHISDSCHARKEAKDQHQVLVPPTRQPSSQSGASVRGAGTSAADVTVSVPASTAAVAASTGAAIIPPLQQVATACDESHDLEAAARAPVPACACGHAPGLARASLVGAPAPAVSIDEEVVAILAADHHSHLTRMGLLSGLAVGIHNFPEGLATFVGALADPTAGVAIAVAIALHNIPEGIVVAMPIYYATGSKWKGFLWSVVCGLSEPIAGLVGWLILRGRDSDPLMYGVMFAIVAGMMVYISLVELIPTALRYDTENRYTTRGVLFGMVVMAASLLMFQV